MTGVSYNGTLPNQVATTGVEGLRDDRAGLGDLQLVRLLPRQRPGRAPHSRPGSVQRYQGEDLDVLAEFVDGPTRAEAVPPTWSRRSRAAGPGHRRLQPLLGRPQLPPQRRRGAGQRVRGARPRTTGTSRPSTFAGWWDALAEDGVPRKIWLHQGGHGGPVDDRRSTRTTLNRWMGHWLFGVRNGITRGPRADVQRPGRQLRAVRRLAGAGRPQRPAAPRGHPGG